MSARPRQIAEINVVPYIDVMLVLLIIFMVTAPLLKQGVDVTLPQADNEPLSTPQETIVVTIDQKGALYMSVGDAPRQAQSEDDVYNTVSEILQTKPLTAVMVAGDHRLEYGKVVTVMSLLQAAGAPRVGLLTELPEAL